MGRNTKIEWAHHSFNPVWGCIRKSEECENCYAEIYANRWNYEVWGPASTTPRREFGEAHWQKPLLWNIEAKDMGERKRVFCASMADIFEEHPVYNTVRPRLWQLINLTQELDWLLLTKEPHNILKMIPKGWIDNPPRNVWYGTSVGLNKSLWRIAELIKVPAHVRFVSAEPLLEEVDFTPYMIDEKIHWIITGGESGPKKRPFDCDWARTIRDQCEQVEIAFFMKQVDKVQEIPADLMIRQLPKQAYQLI